MEASKSSPQAPGSPEATEGQAPSTTNKKVQIRLTISPSPAKSTASSPPTNTPLAPEASASEIPTAENSIEETTTGDTSTAAEESQGKAPATKKKPKPKKSSKKKKASPASASNSTPLNKAAAEPTNPTTPPRQISVPERTFSAPATISTPPAKRPGTPITPSTPTKKVAVEPTKPPIPHSKSPAPKATSHRPSKFTAPTDKAVTAPSSSITNLFPQPHIHSRRRETEPAMGSGEIELPEFQIMCCNGGVYANSGLHNQSHHELKAFVKKFAGTDALPVHHPKSNVYGVIWTEYRYVIGITEFDPNDLTWQAYFYGCNELTKGEVVELLPPVRPMICTTVDAAKRNEECLVRVDGGVDFQCKTHGDWRWTAYFVTWQAPGELDRRNKEAEKLAKKMKKRGGSSGGFEAYMGGLGGDAGGGTGSMMGGSQMDGAGGDIEDGGYFNAEFEASRRDA